MMKVSGVRLPHEDRCAELVERRAVGTTLDLLERGEAVTPRLKSVTQEHSVLNNTREDGRRGLHLGVPAL
eukprot:1118682-Heterocapsa_arctica.AAC.1